MHFQTPPFEQSKIICVLKGKILDVIVDLRKNSKTYGHYKSFEISSEKFNLLYIPHYFAHGFLVKSSTALVYYKVTKKYSPKNEKTLLWSDKTISIDWKILKKDIIVSQKDQKGKLFNKISSPF